MVLKTKFIMTLMLVPFNTEFSVKSPLSYYQYDVPSCEYEWHEDSNISI